MQLVMLGTGSPFLDLRRNGPAQAVHVAGEYLLFDCGDNVTRQLMTAGITPADVTKLFITHLHTDHTHGLSQFVIGGWIQGRTQLQIHGAGEVSHLVKTLFEDAYQEDVESRLTVRDGAGLTNIKTTRVSSDWVLETDRYRVTAAPAQHVLDAHAFRVDGDGGSVVVTGDTSYSAPIVRLATGAHTIVHECFMAERQPSGPLPKITALHSTPETAGQVAAEAGVSRLVLTHFMPGVDPVDVKARAQSVFDGEVVVAEDLLSLDVG